MMARHFRSLSRITAAFAVLAAACGGDPFQAGPADEHADGGELLDEAAVGAAGDASRVADAISTLDSPTSAEGAADAPSPVCLTDLSGVGTRDFRIAFRLTTTASGGTYALLSQRTGCDMSSAWWDVTLQPLGGVELATDDGTAASYVFVEAGDSVNDGKAHQVVVARENGSLVYYDDGVLRSSAILDASNFGDFAGALSIGRSSCSAEAPLAGHGAISNVCITSP